MIPQCVSRPHASFLFVCVVLRHLLTTFAVPHTLANEHKSLSRERHLRREVDIGDSQDPLENGMVRTQSGAQHVHVPPRGSSLVGFEDDIEAHPTFPPVDNSNETAERSCGETLFAPKGSCPESCPYTAEVKDKACNFRCVKQQQCGKQGLLKEYSIPDEEEHNCRRCKVLGCKECEFGQEKCLQCMGGYEIQYDGTCWSWGVLGFRAFCVPIVLGIMIVIWYLVDLFFLRKNVNEDGETHGMKYQYDTVTRVPDGTPPEKAFVSPHGTFLYPFFHNLLVDDAVGGVGLCLHMRFQVYLIFWSFVLFASYWGLGLMQDTDLLTIGRKETNPAREMVDLCQLVRWGAKKSEELEIIKVCFMFFAYLFTFVSAFGCALSNELFFRNLDGLELTMKDFMAKFSGLPEVDGTNFVELELQDLVEEATDCKCIGVSPAWVYQDIEESVMQCLEQEKEMLERCCDPKWQRPLEKPKDAPPSWSAWNEGGPSTNFTYLRMIFTGVDSIFRVFLWGIPIEEPLKMDKDRIQAMLQGLVTSETAFVVFDSEADRDKAVEVFASKNAPNYRGRKLKLEASDLEPGTVIWQNYNRKGKGHKVGRMLKWAVAIVVIIFAWTLFFFMPAIYYIASQTLASGEEMGLTDINYWILQLMVILGNNIMYNVCDFAAANCEFETEDDRQAFYIILYSMSVFIGSTVDLLGAGCVVYIQMMGKNVHTADGRKIVELDSLQEIIESYPMQRALGKMLLQYCWPSVYLGFIIEFIMLGFVVNWLASAIVRSRPELRGRKAEQAMWRIVNEMEMGRYADLIYNALLGCLVFLVAGGYTHTMFLYMFIGSIGFYVWDHWRIIRITPTFCYSGKAIDKTGQALMSLPAAIILGTTIFKLNCIFDKDGSSFWFAIKIASLAGVIHIALHVYLVTNVVTRLGASISKPVLHGTYEEVARKNPMTFFSVNPVHCLRSKFVLKHQVPLASHRKGKEYLMWDSPELGAYYNQAAKQAGLIDKLTQEMNKDPVDMIGGKLPRPPPGASKEVTAAPDAVTGAEGVPSLVREDSAGLNSTTFENFIQKPDASEEGRPSQAGAGKTA